MRTGREVEEVQRVKEPEILGPSRRWTKGIGKQSDGFKCRARPDFNGRFTKSYRLPFPLRFRIYMHVCNVYPRYSETTVRGYGCGI